MEYVVFYKVSFGLTVPGPDEIVLIQIQCAPVCKICTNSLEAGVTKSFLTAGSHRPSTRGNFILRSIWLACISEKPPDLFKIFDLDNCYSVTFELGCSEFCIWRVFINSNYSFQRRSQPDFLSCICKFLCAYDRIRNQFIKKWIMDNV